MSSSTLTASVPGLRITRRGRTVVAILLAVPLATGAVAFGLGQGAAAQNGSAGPVSSGNSASSSGYRYVTVGAGESLWSVARRLAPGADPRDVIADILDLNQLPSASTQPGDRLAVPAKYGR